MSDFLWDQVMVALLLLRFPISLVSWAIDSVIWVVDRAIKFVESA